MYSKTIDKESKHQTIMGPRGIKLVLDASQIFPNNPGDGTPCLIYYKRETMTLECGTQNVGEIIPEAESYEDAEWAYDWINSLYDAADEWLTYHWDRIELEQKNKDLNSCP